ncbi:MAG: putative sulfate exporter family transporter, partial [Candidatus Roizmanbacteria bacterium]|nr:putative sulfate exporter family transporter [Candidatus Roizmanbacteria bacterium]
MIILSIVLFKGGTDLKKLAPAFKWTTDSQVTSRADKWTKIIDGTIPEAEAKGEIGAVNRLQALKEAIGKGDDRKDIAKAAEKVQTLGGKPGAIGKEIAGHAKNVPGKIFTGENIGKVIKIGIFCFILATIGLAIMGGQVGRFVIGFPIVFVLAWLSRFIAGNGLSSDYGFEYVVFALILGLLISNTVGTPEWLKPAVQTEYYIKTGLVILGAGILFFEILQGGALGIIQAVLVVSVIWYACFWLCRKLKVDDDFAAMLSTAVSICGVSAAIAACGAVQGDKKKLSYVTSLVLIVAVPMMILMPWAVKSFGIPDLVGGAWIGGTLDTSGSVVAAGSLISEPAMKTGVIVKFSQNVLIGVAAFILSVWWVFKKGATTGEKPSAKIIWERFPKFVLGFLVASCVFSFMLHIDTI